MAANQEVLMEMQTDFLAVLMLVIAAVKKCPPSAIQLPPSS